MTDDASIDRLYILDGGLAQVEDGSVYSPGRNVGVPMTLSCNAYLIRHRDTWVIWDTGTEDALAAEPAGRIVAHGIRGIVRKPVAAQLAEIGVRPEEISTILVSHGHYDHVGNCRLFRHARWIAQKAEHDAMFGPDPASYGYLPALYATLREDIGAIVEGDHDLFGDGALRLVFTPGHTPGHCSLLVRLPETGPVLLSADVAHNRDNFRHRRVPVFNWDAAATIASMDKVDALLHETGATLWINHDTEQNATLPHAPHAIR
jgi:N-acyl homoserine lactone hydrolase